MKKIRIYIAGKISGLPYSKAEENFMKVQRILEKLGFDAVNPFEEGKKLIGASYEDYLQHGLKLLSTCQAVCLLPDWSNSRGAVLEEHYARITGKHLLFADTLDNLFPKEEGMF